MPKSVKRAYEAIGADYRLIDPAVAYENEEVRQAIRRSGRGEEGAVRVTTSFAFLFSRVPETTDA